LLLLSQDAIKTVVKVRMQLASHTVSTETFWQLKQQPQHAMTQLGSMFAGIL
jgi:hypothetical protein